jgi:hypothetical protein
MAEMSDLGEILRAHGIADSSLQRLNEVDSYYLAVPGAEVVARWSALRNIFEETGYWPVVLGGADDLARHKQELANQGSADHDQILAGARAHNGEVWLRSRLDQFHTVHADQLDELHEEWPADVEHDDTFSIPIDPGTAQMRATCYLGLVPAGASWQVPALLRFGGWHDCPEPAVHVSVLARWERMYAAEIVGMTHDTLELTIGNPPTEPGEALDLAYEQLGYCEDVVLQGTLTLERLAATLLHGRVWFFWWD